MTTIENIDPDLFLLAAHFVSSEETRYYLRGVFVERAVGGGALYTATDGHRLFHAYDAKAIVTGDNAIVGIAKPKFPAGWYKADFLSWDGSLLQSSHGDVMSADRVEGEFPAYQHIIPDRAPEAETVSAYNWKYLADIEAAAKRSGLHGMRVNQDGHNVALITFADDAPCYGLVMPMRVRDIDPKPDLPLPVTA